MGGVSLNGTDWKNLESVKSLADRLGRGQSVVKYPDRANYNIMFTSRENELPPGVEVLYRTK